MPKNIVLLLDGTSNEIKTNRSNILRLYGTLQKSDDQLVYYDPGVGTLGGGGAWLQFWHKVVEVWEMMTGFGLDFIHALGLIEPRNLNLLRYAYRAYKRINKKKEASFDEIRLYERALRADRIPVQALGLFDTVSSLIEWGRFRPQLKTHVFTRTNTSVQCIRHAVAIDERRTMFRPQLWPLDVSFLRNRFNPKEATPQDAKEVWFAGVHGDVGGGYPEAESALAKIPLHWMIEEMKAQGLLFKTRTVNELVLGTREDRDYVRPDPLGRLHNSMNKFWPLFEFIPRRKPENSTRPSLFGISLGLFEPRHIPEEASVHQSVVDRINGGTYSPPNLPKDYTVEG